MSLAHALPTHGESTAALRQAGLAMRGAGARDGRLAQQHALILQRLARRARRSRASAARSRCCGEPAKATAPTSSRCCATAGSCRPTAARCAPPRPTCARPSSSPADRPAAVRRARAVEPRLARDAARRPAGRAGGLRRRRAAVRRRRRRPARGAGGRSLPRARSPRACSARRRRARGAPSSSVAAASSASSCPRRGSRWPRPSSRAASPRRRWPRPSRPREELRRASSGRAGSRSRDHVAVRAAFAARLARRGAARARAARRRRARGGGLARGRARRAAARRARRARARRTEDAAHDLATITAGARQRPRRPAARRLARRGAAPARRRPSRRRGPRAAGRARGARAASAQPRRDRAARRRDGPRQRPHGARACGSRSRRVAPTRSSSGPSADGPPRSGSARRGRRTTPRSPPTSSELRTVLAAIGDAGKERGGHPRLLRRQTELEGAIRRRARHAAAGPDASATHGGAAGAGPAARGAGRRACSSSSCRTRGALCAVVVAARARPRLVALGARADDVAHELASLRSALRRLARGVGLGPSRAMARANAEHAAARLDELLLGPLRTCDRRTRRELVLVPTGELHAVPWAALPSCAARPLSVAPSAALWLRAAAERRGAPQPTASGARCAARRAGPGLPRGGGRGPHARRRHPGADRCCAPRRRERRGASRRRSRPRARAHREPRHVSRRQPAVLGAAARRRAATVYDLERLSAAPRDMILSACDGGVTAVRPGDELMGFSGALLALGTSALVASVVPVPDEPTHRLMLALHERLAAGCEPAPALALARADALGDDGADYATAAGVRLLRRRAPPRRCSVADRSRPALASLNSRSPRPRLLPASGRRWARGRAGRRRAR